MEQDVKTEWMEISPEEFRCDAFQVWGDNWLALAAGDFEEKRFNAMTVGWGFFGTMWAAPAVMVVVRPQRYTLEFLDEYSSFTRSIAKSSLSSANTPGAGCRTSWRRRG